MQVTPAAADHLREASVEVAPYEDMLDEVRDLASHNEVPLWADPAKVNIQKPPWCTLKMGTPNVCAGSFASMWSIVPCSSAPDRDCVIENVPCGHICRMFCIHLEHHILQ